MAQKTRDTEAPADPRAKVATPTSTIDRDREFLLASASVHKRRKQKKKDHKTGHPAAHLHVTHSDSSYLNQEEE